MEALRAHQGAAVAAWNNEVSPGSTSSTAGRFQVDAAVTQGVGSASWNSVLGLQTVPGEQHRVGSLQQYKSAISQPEDSVLLPMRRELRCLEDKITRQLLRLQDQNQRVVDMMLEPLDAKVASLEGKLKGTDSQVAELVGGLRALQDAMQTQAQRTDSSEVRLQRWRKSFEADLLARLANLETALGSQAAARIQDMVTHSDLADVAGLMKKELRKLLQEALARSAEVTPTHEELDAFALEMRQELKSIQAESGREELVAVAESLRSELRLLSEASLTDASSGVARSGSLEVHSKGVEELIERATQSKAAMEEVSSDIRYLRDELRSRGLLGGSGPWSQPPLGREEVQLIAEQACSQARGHGAEEIGFVVRELEERVTDAAARLEQLAGDASSCRSMSETLAVVQDTTNMRLEAMEQRQCYLRDEVRGLSGKDGGLDRAWQAVEDNGMRQVVEVQHLGQLAQRVGELERAGHGDQFEGLIRRVRSLELAPKAEELFRRLEVLERRAPADLLRRLEAMERRGLTPRNAAMLRDAAAPSSLHEVTVLAEGLAQDLGMARGTVDGAPEAAMDIAGGALAAEPLASDAVVDVRSQLAAIWSTLAELAELAGNKVGHGTGPHALAKGGASEAMASSPEATGPPARVANAATGEGEQTEVTAVVATAAATEAMIGAVRDAIAAVSECRRDADGFQRKVGTIAEELVDLRGEWSQMRTRVSTCEKGLGELRSKANTIDGNSDFTSASTPEEAGSTTAGVVCDAAEPTKGDAAATADGKDNREGLSLEARPTFSPRTPPTCDPETLHPRRTSSPANRGESIVFGGVEEEATEKGEA